MRWYSVFKHSVKEGDILSQYDLIYFGIQLCTQKIHVNNLLLLFIALSTKTELEDNEDESYIDNNVLSVKISPVFSLH